MVHVTHLITTLTPGGAENMLYKLVSAMDGSVMKNSVICLDSSGSVGRKIEALGIPVIYLGMRTVTGRIALPVVLARSVARLRPDILQTWMYHANLIGSIAAITYRIPIIWNLRRSGLDRTNKAGTKLVSEICARLSTRIPKRIVCCSASAGEFHSRAGYASEKMTVIPNGFDLSVFRPDPTAVSSLRQELGISADKVLVGLVGRFDPAKDHLNFVKAAEAILTRSKNVEFLLCGDGIVHTNPILMRWLTDRSLLNHCHLLGVRDDMPRIMAGLDLLMSSSKSEGFPNVIGEAMSCGVPCVVTNVGDSAFIVGDTGRVVESCDPTSLACACLDLISSGPEHRLELGRLARMRIENFFEVSHIVSQYSQMYEEIASECAV